MAKRTRVKTHTITHTQILLATLATLLANGLALAALPLSKKVPTPSAVPPLTCSSEIIGSARTCTVKKNVGGFRSFTYRCPNGKTFNVTTSCRTKESLQKIANENCSKKKYCIAPVVAPVVTPTAPLLNKQYQIGERKITSPGLLRLKNDLVDVGFFGRAEENITFYRTADKQSKVKVRVTNRGPANLPLPQQAIDTRQLVITFLTLEQQEIPLPAGSLTVELPAIASGQSIEKVFTIDPTLEALLSSRAVLSIKAQINVGNRAIGGAGVFDSDISNNTLIFEIPNIFPFPLGEDPV